MTELTENDQIEEQSMDMRSYQHIYSSISTYTQFYINFRSECMCIHEAFWVKLLETFWSFQGQKVDLKKKLSMSLNVDG